MVEWALIAVVSFLVLFIIAMMLVSIKGNNSMDDFCIEQGYDNYDSNRGWCIKDDLVIFVKKNCGFWPVDCNPILLKEGLGWKKEQSLG